MKIFVIVLGRKQRSSAIHIHVSSLLQTPLCLGCRMTVLHDNTLCEQCSLCYTSSLLVIHFKYGRVYLSILNSLTIPPPLLPPGNEKIALISLSLFLFCEWVHLYHVFLNSTYKGCDNIFLILWLTSFSMTISRSNDVAANYIILFDGYVIFHWVYVPLFFIHSSVDII